MEKNSCDLSVKRFIFPIKTVNLIYFLTACVALYVAIFAAAQRFDWERDSKKATEHYYNILYLILLAFFIFNLANVNNTFGLQYGLGMILGGFGIAILGQLPGFNFSFGSLSSLTGIPLITVIAIAGVIGYFVYLTWRNYHSCGMDTTFYLCLGIPLALIIISYILAWYDSAHVEVHLHHWQWALALVFFARFPKSPTSSILAGLFTGIVIDGISRYGPDPLFEPI